MLCNCCDVLKTLPNRRLILGEATPLPVMLWLVAKAHTGAFTTHNST